MNPTPLYTCPTCGQESTDAYCMNCEATRKAINEELSR